MAQDEIQYFPHADLTRHPHNMRQIYPEADVADMAQSIAERGIIQPLVAVRGDTGRIWIVAGNLRLTACQSLGDDAPLVPVIIRDLTEEQQLLDMAAENAVRFNPDPISEGKHYRRILERTGMNANKLHLMTGVGPATIANRLNWARLEPEIQMLGRAGRLPKTAADSLIQIPHTQDRIFLATRFARHRVTARGIRRGVQRHLERIGLAKAFDMNHPNGRAVALAEYMPPARSYHRAAVDTESPVRLAAAEACRLCPNRDDLGVPEPAWTILSHGAREACEACGLDYMREICNECPLVRALRHAYRDMARQEGKVPHQVF